VRSKIIADKENKQKGKQLSCPPYDRLIR